MLRSSLRYSEQAVEKEVVTPAKAGVQELKNNCFIDILDSGVRRNDEV